MTEISPATSFEQEFDTEVKNYNEVEKTHNTILGKKIICIILYIFLLVGVGIGAYVSINCDNELYKKLDFLFAGNISTKLEQNIFNTFLSSYSSNCIFLVIAFLLGGSLWGSVLQGAVIFFRGFGIGISAAYLFYTYKLNGAVYYVGVMLPCVFVSVMSLVMLQKESFVFSGRLLSAIYKKDKTENILLQSRFNSYIKKFLLSLIINLVAALLDVSLTFIFGGSFHF